MARELRTADGGFAASLDADTDGEEGATYVWDKAEIDELLGADAAEFDAAYGVTDNGNWEGRTILRRADRQCRLGCPGTARAGSCSRLGNSVRSRRATTRS